MRCTYPVSISLETIVSACMYVNGTMTTRSSAIASRAKCWIHTTRNPRQFAGVVEGKDDDRSVMILDEKQTSMLVDNSEDCWHRELSV